MVDAISKKIVEIANEIGKLEKQVKTEVKKLKQECEREVESEVKKIREKWDSQIEKVRSQVQEAEANANKELVGIELGKLCHIVHRTEFEKLDNLNEDDLDSSSTPSCEWVPKPGKIYADGSEESQRLAKVLEKK